MPIGIQVLDPASLHKRSPEIPQIDNHLFEAIEFESTKIGVSWVYNSHKPTLQKKLQGCDLGTGGSLDVLGKRQVRFIREI